MATRSKKSTHNELLPVHDVLDLKGKIRELKSLQESLLKEREILTADIANKEQIFSKYRQELTLLEPTKDLRWQDTDLANEETFSQADAARYNLLNEKFDMQVLIHELYQALPVLEQKMKLIESKSQIYSKSLTKNTKFVMQQANAHLQAKKSPASRSVLWKTPQELQILMSSRIGEIVEKKNEQASRCIEAERRTEQLVHSILPLRHSVELAFLEKTEVKMGSILNLNKNVQNCKIEYLCSQTKLSRNRLRKYGNGFGWQRELFRHFLLSRSKRKHQSPFGNNYIHDDGSGESGTMSLDEVKKCLRFLIFPRNEGSDISEWYEESTLRSLLRDIVFEELLQDERKAQHMNSLLPNSATNTKPEKGKVDNISPGAGDDGDDAMFDEEVEELLVIPPSSQPLSDLKLPQEKEDALRREAQDRVMVLNEVDERLFCLLCSRLIASVE